MDAIIIAYNREFIAYDVDESEKAYFCKDYYALFTLDEYNDPAHEDEETWIQEDGGNVDRCGIYWKHCSCIFEKEDVELYLPLTESR